MTAAMPRELFVFLVMICCGSVLSLFFDLLRAVRSVVQQGKTAAAVSDAFFWIVSGFISVACVWNFYGGKFRFFEPLGIFLGAVFYFSLLSGAVLKLLTFVIDKIFKFIGLILKILLTPALFLYKILVVPAKEIFVCLFGIAKSKLQKNRTGPNK